MKIGILTLFWNNNNWGGNLQGYALKHYLEMLYPEAAVDIIKYSSSCNVIYKNKYEQMLQYGPSDIVKKFQEKVVKKGKSNPKLNRRTALFRQFQKLQLSNPKEYTDSDLNELASEYDCLICGSDQIWNPNVARPAFFLKGIEGCRKVSYAASIARDQLSKKEAEIMVPLISAYDYISVREKTAKKILDGYIKGRKKIYEVLDPALMLPRDEWEKFGNNGKDESANDKYALAFFFSDSYEYRQELKKFCQEKHLLLLTIPHAARYIESDEKGFGEKIYDVGPIEFIDLFRNASYVFTDSFHGAVFSIIFEKNFCVFERDKNNKVSKNSRLYDLLSKFELSDRMAKKCEDLYGVVSSGINYDRVNILLEKYRNFSKQFIKISLNGLDEKKHKVLSTVADLAPNECCGCGLCENICPKSAISFKEDEEGFYFPQVDAPKCIACRKCLNYCVQNSKTEKYTDVREAFVAYNKDEKVRQESSSGGIFYALASKIVSSGGIVYGAAFDKNFSVRHIRVDKINDLDKIMRSKYVQSDITPVFGSIISDLSSGNKVLFSGTPCQVAAIYRLAKIKKQLDNLLLVDFICHGVPSPGIWHSYLDSLNSGSDIESINFRDKQKAGWHDFYMHIANSKSAHISQSHEINAYMRSFLSDWNIRQSCYQCLYKDTEYVSDITLGDAWKIEKVYSKWADNKGTSLVIVRSEKGKKTLNFISSEINLRTTDYEDWTKYNHSLVLATSKPDYRKKMFDLWINSSTSDFWKSYSKISIKKKLRYETKRALKFLGLDKIARKFR